MQSELSIIQSQMAPRLRSFLSLVWEKRNEADLDLYKLYVGGRPHHPSADYEAVGGRAEVVGFLAQLEHCMNLTAIQVEIQPWGDLADIDVDFDYAKEIAEKLGGWPDVGKSFYHFPKGEEPNWRIYLNVPSMHRGTVACFIVAKIVKALHGATNAKVMGPSGIGWDAIVIYLADEISVNEALKIIAAYQEKNLTHFSDQIIHLARQSEYEGKKLIGVATACEPTHYAKQIGKTSASFGSFWKALLMPILNETKAQSEKVFATAVLNKMRELGMDPLHPER